MLLTKNFYLKSYSVSDQFIALAKTLVKIYTSNKSISDSSKANL